MLVLGLVLDSVEATECLCSRCRLDAEFNRHRKCPTNFWSHRCLPKILNFAPGLSLPFCDIPGHQVQAVNRFAYLCSDADSSGYCTPKILRRIGLASSIMPQLDRVWKQSRLSNTTKFRIYNSSVLSSLLYTSET